MKKHYGNTGRILEHLKTNHGITSKEAFELYGATRLSAIIFNLRKEGYVIMNDRKYCNNRFGEKCHYDEYVLIGEEV